MRRRSLITFVILNILISAGAAYLVINLTGRNQPASPVQYVTFEKIVTATIDPNATIPVRIVTATPLPGAPEVGVVPTGIFDAPDFTNVPAATFDTSVLGENVALQGTATALPQNCILHTVKEGDTPYGIAEEYGSDGFRLMEVNGLDDVTAGLLQVGDVLIVPLEGCALTAADVASSEDGGEAAAETETPEVTAESTETVTPTPTIRPTVTLAPTAASAQIEILNVINPGDISSEAVQIRNNGNTVNVTGWTLRDNEGNTFDFPEQILFSAAEVTIHTRSGDNTPIALFWGRDEAVWTPGDVVTLTDARGNVQSTFRVPSPVNLP